METSDTVKSGNLSREELLKILKEKEELISAKDELIASRDELLRERDDQIETLESRMVNKPTRSAHSGIDRKYLLEIRYNHNPISQLRFSEREIAGIINKALETEGVKMSQKLEVDFEKPGEGGDTLRRNGFFRSGPEVVTNSSQIIDAIRDTSSRVMLTIDKWTSEGSGWVVSRVVEHELSLHKYDPTPTADQRDSKRRSPEKGSSYIHLPKELSNSKKGLINMRNHNDHKCFMWSHVRFLKEGKNPGRITISDVEFSKTLDYEGIDFPVQLGDIPKIEKANNIRVNVFGYEEGKFYPQYISKAVTENVMNLLLITDGKGNGHYVLIKSLSSLFHSISKGRNAKHFCYYCIQPFSSEKILRNHTERCISINGVQAVEYPKPGSTVKFKCHYKQLRVPFIIYADFESILESIPEEGDPSDAMKTKESQSHKCCGFAYKVVCSYDENLSKSIVTYRGNDAANVFLRKMLSEEKWCRITLGRYFNKPLEMSDEDTKLFNEQKTCHICDKGYEEGTTKVADHCHYTGKFRGAAHKSCNLGYGLTRRITIVFHNLSGYDGHFLVPEFGKFKREVSIIPINSERYKQ